MRRNSGKDGGLETEEREKSGKVVNVTWKLWRRRGNSDELDICTGIIARIQTVMGLSGEGAGGGRSGLKVEQEANPQVGKYVRVAKGHGKSISSPR